MLKDRTSDATFNLRLLRSMPGAEKVTYMPVAGGERTVWAVVDRSDFAAAHYAVDASRQVRMSITVVNDADVGIASSAYNSGGDAVAVPGRVGEPFQVFQMTGEPAVQDGGLVKYLLR